MESSSSSRNFNFTILLLIAIAAMVAISRIYLLDFPAGNDESMYFLLGNETLRGNIPYTTFYEMKPPFLFYSYAIIGLLFGNTVYGLHLGGLIISIFSTVLIYNFVRNIYCKEKALQAAVLFWVLISSSQLYGMYLLLEHFVILYILCALNIVIRDDTKVGIRHFIAGLFMGIALLTKQTALFFIPAFIYFVWKKNERFSFAKKLIWAGLGGLTLLLGNLIVFYFLGNLDDAYYWIMEHGKAYASGISMDNGAITLKFFSKQFFENHWLLLLMALAGVTSLGIYKRKDTLLFILLLLLGATLSLFVGLRFYGQYWILLVPGIALAGIWVTDFKPWIKKSGLIFSLVLLANILIQHKNYFPSNKEQFADQLFRGQYFSKTKLISEKLNRVISKEDKLLVLGGLPQTYVYTKKNPFTRHIWTPMINYKSKKCAEFRQELVEDFEKTKPKYVLFSYNEFHWTMTEKTTDEIYKYMYRRINREYNKIMAIDLNDSQMYYKDQIENFAEKANSIFVYERK